MKNVHAVALPNGKDKMWGKEKRLGYLRALIADIEHPAGNFRAVTVHLDAHSSSKHRHLQMKIVLDHLEILPELPTIIGGDWNTTTYNAQTGDARDCWIFSARIDGREKCREKSSVRIPTATLKKVLFRRIQKARFRL